MYSSFWWGKKVDDFLFKGFSVNSVGGILGLCLITFSMAFLFEYFRYVQVRHKQKELALRVKQLKLICPTESATLLVEKVTNLKNPFNITLCDRAILFGTEITLWLLLQNLGYFLMLSIMIYDAWFLISAILGGGLGYFIFGYMFMKTNLQNCQIMRRAFCTQICGETEIKQEQSTPPILCGSPSSSQNPLEGIESQTSHVKVHAQCH